jgi:hypothetical protein
MVVAYFKLFGKRIQRIYLRFVHGFYIHVHREPDVAVPQNGLDVLVCNAWRVKIRCKAASECVPAVPHRERFIALEGVSADSGRCRSVFRAHADHSFRVDPDQIGMPIGFIGIPSQLSDRRKA